MKKRLIAVPLWFLTGWYVGSVAAWLFGLGPALPWILAVASAAMFVGDPRQVIWRRRVTQAGGLDSPSV